MLNILKSKRYHFTFMLLSDITIAGYAHESGQYLIHCDIKIEIKGSALQGKTEDQELSLKWINVS